MIHYDQLDKALIRPGRIDITLEMKNASRNTINQIYEKVRKMINKEQILKEIDQLPNLFWGEVLDFIIFLKIRHLNEKLETALLSESSLKKDWLSPEEEEAWKDL